MEDRTRADSLERRTYMDLEVDEDRGDAAKRIFYRAIAACPWSKDVWLHALRRPQILTQFSKTELLDLVEMMSAKELRVRTMLEEVFPSDMLPPSKA
ncbi:hypothetical protein T484DRAFT_1774887 [Baffinella frigidus]|nr:hypothetical protein T484DRAFT_1774887 [Cryptophyta sp. CCMP2293]